MHHVWCDGAERTVEKRRFPAVSSNCQTLISQPLPLVERLGERIPVAIEGAFSSAKPAQDGGEDQDAGADLGWECATRRRFRPASTRTSSRSDILRGAVRH